VIQPLLTPASTGAAPLPEAQTPPPQAAEPAKPSAKKKTPKPTPAAPREDETEGGFSSEDDQQAIPEIDDRALENEP